MCGIIGSQVVAYVSKADLWSLAICLIEMANKEPPNRDSRIRVSSGEVQLTRIGIVLHCSRRMQQVDQRVSVFSTIQRLSFKNDKNGTKGERNSRTIATTPVFEERGIKEAYGTAVDEHICEKPSIWWWLAVILKTLEQYTKGIL